jgi:hypothetical protein
MDPPVDKAAGKANGQIRLRRVSVSSVRLRRCGARRFRERCFSEYPAVKMSSRQREHRLDPVSAAGLASDEDIAYLRKPLQSGNQGRLELTKRPLFGRVRRENSMIAKLKPISIARCRPDLEIGLPISAARPRQIDARVRPAATAARCAARFQIDRSAAGRSMGDVHLGGRVACATPRPQLPDLPSNARPGRRRRA